MARRAVLALAALLGVARAHPDLTNNLLTAAPSDFYATSSSSVSSYDTRSLDQANLADPATRPSHTCLDVGRFPKDGGTTSAEKHGYHSTTEFEIPNTVGTTTPQTCWSSGIEVPRSPHRTDGQCGSALCNGYDPLVPLGRFNEASGDSVHEQATHTTQAHVSTDIDCTDFQSCTTHLQRKGGRCYSDTDCQFYSKDSQGLMSGEIVGKCVRKSDHHSMCECLPAYFGTNCEFKRCPRAKTTGFMCNGVQGEGGNSVGESYASGEDYYGPVKMGEYQGNFMGSEWNTYDQVLDVNFDISTGSHHMQRGDTQVGGICDFETGRCNCHDTWYGATCEHRRCPFGQGYNQLYATECSGQGECITERDGQNAICKCTGNFHGLDCSLHQCPNSTRGFICDNPLLDTPEREPGVVSGHQCDWNSGHCKCDGDFYGPDCTWKKCPRVNDRVCNGQGVCYAATHYGTYAIGPRSEGNFTDSEGKKHNFAPTWTDRTTGSAIEGQMPDGQSGDTVRSGWQSGQKYGVCSCRWPFFGEDCTLRMCPNSTNEGSGSGLTCDGHGACDHNSGFCTCEPGYFGRDCHLRMCPFSSNNQQRRPLECNGEGTCDRSVGKCLCSGSVAGGKYSWLAKDDWREHLGVSSRDNREYDSDHGIQDSQGDYHAGIAPASITAATDDKLDRWTIGVTMKIEGEVRLVKSNEMAPSAVEWRGDHEQLHSRYWGVACEKLHCPSYPDALNQRGLRSSHTENSHDVDAYRTYTNECSGPTHGDCNVDTGKCICLTGWYGPDCSQKGKGDGTANRRMDLQYEPTNALRPDGTLKNEGWFIFRDQFGMDHTLDATGTRQTAGVTAGANPNGINSGSIYS